MTHFKTAAAITLIGCTVACAGNDTSGGDGMPSVTSDTYVSAEPLPMDPSRRITEQDCSKAIETDRGNLRCR